MELKATEKAIDKYGKDVVVNLIAKLKQMDANSSGRLINSLSYQLKEGVEQLQIELIGEDYFNNIEMGRRPGSVPPLAAITKWAQLKGIPRSAAFAIAKHIGKFGIKPRPMLAEIIKKTERQNEINIENALEKDVEKYIDNNIINNKK